VWNGDGNGKMKRLRKKKKKLMILKWFKHEWNGIVGPIIYHGQ
jgi:hypothetical protein